MSKEQIIPVGEYLLVGIEPVTNESETLILNISSKENNRGIVKAIGEKVNTDEESTKILEGDTIIFVPSAGVRVTNSEDSDILISVKNVIGLIKGE